MANEESITLAWQYLAIAQPDRALATLESAEADVADVDFWRLRALALIGVERYGEARSAAASGLAIEPDDVQLLSTHADASALLKDFAGAERSLLAALRHDPENEILLADYARLVLNDGQLDKARALVDEASRIDPGSAYVATTRAIVAYLSGRDAEAATHAEDVLAEDPEALSPHLMRGLALSQQGRRRDATRHLDTVAASRPADRDLAEAAREARRATHPLLVPLAPVARWGSGLVTLAGFVLVGIAWASGNVWVSLVITTTWLLYVIYSWVVTGLLRAWWKWRR
jgi:tetratricopeptide (TPR) repeat protein